MIRPRALKISCWQVLFSLSIALGCGSTPSHAPLRLVQLAVIPDSVSLAAGDTLSLMLSVTELDGTPAEAIPVRWASTDESVAEISAEGTVLARGTGQATIVVQAPGAQAISTVNVHRDPLPELMVIAHRGYAAVFPENTLVAVRGAFDRGADAVEVDVWLSSDREPIVIHDGTVDRTTDGTGTVTNMTSEALRALDACSWRGTQWGRYPIPIVREVLQGARGRGWVLLDLKGHWSTADLQRLLASIRAEGMRESVMVLRFELPFLATVRVLDPGIALGFLSRDLPPNDSFLWLGETAALVYDSTAVADASTLPQYAAGLRAQGSATGAWTIASPVRATQLRQLGIGWFISDVPLDRGELSAIAAQP
jgi:glycerophosphoryl diester phosphodiesterase